VGGTQPVFGGAGRTDYFVARLGHRSRLHAAVHARNRKSLVHLTRSRPSSEVASRSYSYRHLFSIVKRRPRPSCDTLIRAGVTSPESCVLSAPTGRTLTKGRPEMPAQMRLI
jgi:hypothetical protein